MGHFRQYISRLKEGVESLISSNQSLQELVESIKIWSCCPQPFQSHQISLYAIDDLNMLPVFRLYPIHVCRHKANVLAQDLIGGCAQVLIRSQTSHDVPVCHNNCTPVDIGPGGVVKVIDVQRFP